MTKKLCAEIYTNNHYKPYYSCHAYYELVLWRQYFNRVYLYFKEYPISFCKGILDSGAII